MRDLARLLDGPIGPARVAFREHPLAGAHRTPKALRRLLSDQLGADDSKPPASAPAERR